MKRFFAFMVIGSMLLTAVSCGKRDLAPADTGDTANPAYDEIDPAALGDSEDVSATAPEETGEPAESVLGGLSRFTVRLEGTEPYHEMIYMRDGDFCADGKLMFFDVSEALSEIAASVPAVDLNSAPHLALSAGDGAEIQLNGGYRIYDEDYKLLLRAETLEEVYKLGHSELAGQEVYLYFVVRLTAQSAERCEGCFVKVLF